MGSGAVLERMAPHFALVEAGDAHAGLVSMWQALIEGWVPPASISEARYRALRNAPECLPERVLAGFGASWGGKFFGGYARGHVNEDPYGAAVRSVLRKAEVFRSTGALIRECDYREWCPGSHHLVYCDPPYEGTTGYRTGNFDSTEFWMTCRRWAQSGATLFVSEYKAPPWAECVLEMPRQSRVRRADVDVVVDRLYRVLPH